MTDKEKKNSIKVLFESFCPKSTKSKFIEAIVEKGTSILKAAHHPLSTKPKNAQIPLEGACEGSLACSTCHVILDKDTYKRAGEPTDKEYDLLDMAFNPTATSRLGCQVKIDEGFKNKIIRIPKANKNMAVDGFVPKPH